MHVSAILRRIILLFVLGVLPLQGVAETPREVAWKDLLPRAPRIENPFAKLTVEQRRMLADLASIRERRARGEAAVAPNDPADEAFLTEYLRKGGIDADALLAQREQLIAQQRNLSTEVNPALNGAMIRMPGYLLPLDYSGKQVSEFLLVPWVGACIHTPPPPPNQIVHVKLERPAPYDGLFKPVVVTGRMAAASGSSSVFLVDGSSDIDTSYVMQGARVDPFEE